jgi:hypothetical protein
MTLYVKFDSNGNIVMVQCASFDGSESIDTDTDAAYATWFKGLPSFITDGWPVPGGQE